MTVNAEPLIEVGREGRLQRQPSAVSRHILRIRLYSLLMVMDVLCIGLSFAMGWNLRFGGFRNPAWLNVACAVLPIYAAIAFNGGAYSIDTLKSPSRGALRATGALLAAVGCLLFISYFLKVDLRISRLAVGIALLSSLVSLAIVRKVGGELIRQSVDGKFVSEIVIADGARVNVPSGMTLIDASRAEIEPDAKNPAMLQKLADTLRGVDRVVVACPPESSRAWAMLLKGANVCGEVLASDFDSLGPIAVSSLEGCTTLVVATGPLNLRQRMMKRAFDLAVAIPALIALAPVLALTAIAIKLDSRGPVFFRQPRVGRGNALFDVFKFRSMYTESSDILGTRSTQIGDDRVTRVGRFIRKTSIDELPQLFNVLFGTMSVVGPRPHALGSLAGQQLFWEVDERYWHRHALKPGITGLAQVRGFRGATHRRDDLTRRLQADLEYMSGWSVWRDLFIILSTFKVVVHSRAF